MRISDWSSDVCSSDLHLIGVAIGGHLRPGLAVELHPRVEPLHRLRIDASGQALQRRQPARRAAREVAAIQVHRLVLGEVVAAVVEHAQPVVRDLRIRSEEHTSELPSLMRISYAVFCLKKKKKTH